MGAFENQCREMSKEALIELLRDSMDEVKRLRAWIQHGFVYRTAEDGETALKAVESDSYPEYWSES